MADQKQEPQFLGGGPKFNRVGVQPQDAESPGPVPAATSYVRRNVLIGLAVLALIGLLYWITTGPNGLVHIGGHGGISPDSRPTASDSGPGPAATP